MDLGEIDGRNFEEVRETSLTGLQTMAVRRHEDLRPHLSAWDALAWRAPQQNPCLMPAWAEAGFRHALGSDKRWLCIFAYAGDRLVGVLPVYVSPHPALGHTCPLISTCDHHAPSGDILLAPDRPAEALAALLAELRRQLPNHVGIDLKAVRQNAPLWQALQDGVRGYLVRYGLRSAFSFLDVRQGDFDSYLAGLGKMRRNLRTGRKKLEERGPVTVDLRRGLTAGEDFLPEFLALEASGWKGRNGTAILNDPDKAAFFAALVKNLAARGQLEWHIVRSGDRLAAAQLAVRCGESLVLPKYAYDEDFAECTPGHLLMGEVIRDAFSRAEIAELNPMSVSESHRLLHMPQEEYVDVHLVRRSARAILCQLPRVLKQSAYQNWVRPRISPAMRKAWHKFKRRRGDRRTR